MIETKHYETELSTILNNLPEEKAVEVVDFAKFLLHQYIPTSQSQIDESSLLLQQESLKNIWDNPEEDIYVL